LTDPLGQSQILPYLTGLSGRDFRFTIISFEKKGAYDTMCEEIKAQCKSAGIKWIALPYHKSPPIASTLYDLRLLKTNLKKLYRADPFEIIHCRSYITSLAGMAFSQKHDIRFIFDMRGFWADERVEGGLWNLSNPIYRSVFNFFKRREKEFFEGADAIISLTENAATEIRSWGIPSGRVKVIPTCADLNHFNPVLFSAERKASLRATLGIPSSAFVLMYLGSWGTWYQTREMLEFFEVLREKKPEAVFLIVTPDVQSAIQVGRADIVATKASRKEVPLYISISNASVFFIKPSYSKKASAATKMAELMAMNIPVISNSGWGDVESYLGSHSLVGSFSVSEYEKVIAAIPLSVESRTVASNSFSLETGIRKYRDVYNSL
jgi:glycosyltransferase involved in cell wall biosynthesis